MVQLLVMHVLLVIMSWLYRGHSVGLHALRGDHNGSVRTLCDNHNMATAGISLSTAKKQ
jgi:hypothetical protein